MCWRGHDPERSNGVNCRDCHAIYMRAKRRGRLPSRMPRYLLNREEFMKRARRRIRIVSELAGVSYDTVRMWLCRGLPAGIKSARALAEGMDVPFDRLWSRL